eukprot:Lankesteria_metandrocarpae@DN3419_c0_g1_i1.p1
MSTEEDVADQCLDSATNFQEEGEYEQTTATGSVSSEEDDLIALLSHTLLRGPAELLTGQLHDEFTNRERDITRLLTFIARADRRILVRRKPTAATSAPTSHCTDEHQTPTDVADRSAMTLRQFSLNDEAASCVTRERVPTLSSEDSMGVVRQSIENIDRAVTFLRKIRTQAEESRYKNNHYIDVLSNRVAMMDERNLSATSMSASITPEGLDFAQSSKILDFMIHDFLTRLGLLRTAETLRTNYSLEKLLDNELYEKVELIAQELRSNNLDLSIEFCRRHRKRLSLLQSSCEAEIHLQKFLNLLNDGQIQNAVLFSAKELLTRPDFLESCPDIKKAQALLVFPPGSVPDDLKHFLDTEARCVRLADIFRKAAAIIFGVGGPPLLEVLIAFGLSAISFTSCSRCVSPTCPACHPLLRTYVEQLPLPHHCRSYVRCPLTGRPTSDEDMPLASPAGYVYSESGLNQLRDAESALGDDNEQCIKCRLSGEVFRASQFERLFLP